MATKPRAKAKKKAAPTPDKLLVCGLPAFEPVNPNTRALRSLEKLVYPPEPEPKPRPRPSTRTKDTWTIDTAKIDPVTLAAANANIAMVNESIRPIPTLDEFEKWLDVELLSCQTFRLGWKDTVDDALRVAASLGIVGTPKRPPTGHRDDCEPVLVDLLSLVRNKIAKSHGSAAPLLDKNEVAILRYLNKQFPQLCKQVDFAGGTDMDPKTARAAIKSLEENGYISLPKGERMGWSLTEAGRSKALELAKVSG